MDWEKVYVRRQELFDAIRKELDHAYEKHGALPWGRHEFYGVLKEEVDELWDAIKEDAPQEAVIEELIQVAAMCFRYYEIGDRYLATERAPSPKTEQPTKQEPRSHYHWTDAQGT